MDVPRVIQPRGRWPAGSYNSTRRFLPAGSRTNWSPNSRLEPYDRFYLDWDCYYNKEPYYKPFRDQDFVRLCTDAGFAADNFIEAVMPRYTYNSPQAFADDVAAGPSFDNRTGRFSEEIRWYGLGAFK